MGAIVGIAGAGTRAEAEAMARRLAHRGREQSIAPAGAGWLGAVADRPDGRLRCGPQEGFCCAATVYDANDPLDRLATALREGPRALEAVDADFALARIDTRREHLTLARDFFGCAPLYYTALPSGGVAFASEYKALLALPAVRVEPDRDMVQFLQHGKRLPPGRTLFGNIRAVPPGAVLTLDRNGGVVADHRFAPLRVAARVSDVEQACALIRAELERALRGRSIDCDPPAVALSGGIDSIALTFLLRRLWPDRRLLTFTSGSHDADHEIVTARRVAAAVGSEHHEIITPATLLAESLPRLVWHMEDPYSRSEALQLYELARAAAARGVRVLFGAQGADGLFAGMPKYGLLALMRRHPLARPALQEFYTYTQLGLPPRGLLAKLGVMARFRGSIAPVPRVPGARVPDPVRFPEPGDQFINRTMAGGFQTGVSQDIQKFDRPFAAFGVAYRSPFYDMALVRAAYTIDDALKIRDGRQKWIFREALRPWVPEEFLGIPKFPQRMEANLDLAAALDALADDVLSDAAVRARGLFDPASIAALRRRTTARAYSHEGAMRLWTAIMTELWARAFVDRRAVLSAPPAPARPGDARD